MPKKLKQDISIGVNMKKYRKESGLSQERVAAKLQVLGLDISREVLSQIERGVCNVRVSVLLALADLYQIPIQEFFVDLEKHEL